VFTGIVREIGKVKSLRRDGSAARLNVECREVTEGLELGDSVAVNGVCLSVVKLDGGTVFDVVGNTLSKTNLKYLKVGDSVNLEGAMKLGDKISGHMVTGHVDGVRPLRRNSRTSRGWVIDIASLSEDAKYLIPKGAVAVDGVSLTVGEVYRDFFRIYLIPLTLKDSTLSLKKVGDYINIEFDMMAKYVEKQTRGNVTKDTLRRTGFMD
jgi:riboflavin synthase